MKTRLFTSKEAKDILSELENKIRLTPNIICRYAIIMSIKSKTKLKFTYDNGGQEFHRPVLTGEYDILFRELIKFHENRNISDDEYFSLYLKAHIENGIRMLKTEIDLCGSFDSFLNEYYNPERGGLI